MRHRGVLVGLLALLLAVVIHPGVGRAEFGFEPGSEEFSLLDAEGHPDDLAGSHPDKVLIKFNLNTIEGKADGNVKDLTFELPPGLTGNPSAVPSCSRTVFDGSVAGESCPSDAQVGLATLTIPHFIQVGAPVYNLEPLHDEMGALGLTQGGTGIPVSLQLQPGDHGTTLMVVDLPQTPPILEVEVELWGIPADHQAEPMAPRLPFLTLPSQCGEPIAMTLHADSWQAPDVDHAVRMDSGSEMTGCEAQSFDPSVAFSLTSPAADTPSGARIDVLRPEDSDPDGRATAQIRDAVIAFPRGVTLSPAGIAGLEACSDAQFGLAASTPAMCPGASGIGSVEIESPLLRTPLAGQVYIGGELPGERFRLFVDAAGPGVEVKLVGHLSIDPATGQLSVTLTGLPQIPLERMTLSFSDGPRAPLVTPLDCSAAAAAGRFDSHGGATRDVSSAPEDRGGAACHAATAFEPHFVAGAQEVGAGQETALSITVSREDGEQGLGRLVARLPRGVSPALGTVEPCAASTATAGECPAGSQIGSAVAEVGSGSEPVTLHGDIFLTAPYRRAPFGIALTFRALLGSFDMGTLVVRGGLTMDPHTGQATLETDSLPQILEGVPIRFRTVGLDIDRAGFIHNPTSCAEQRFEATIVSTAGSGSDVASPFQVRRCGSLKFRPTISMALRGAKRLHRRGKPGLRLTLRSHQGSTNLRNARIPLSRSIKLNPTGPAELCARPEAVAGDCPLRSSVGTAVGRTSLFSGRMKGSIYVAQPIGNGLPDLWIDLSKKGIHLLVQARTSSRKGRLTTQLAGMPDLDLSVLRMSFNGGESGIFALRQGVCGAHVPKDTTSRVAFKGQDGAFRLSSVKLRHPRCRPVAARGGHGG